MSLDLTVVVLTYNEERHIRRCIESVRDLARRLVVIDSGSTDRTCDIVEKCGIQLLVNPFINQAAQFNWGLDHADIRTAWVMRLDADEIVTFDLAKELREKLPRMKNEVSGMTVNRQIHFMSKWIRYGGIYPIRTLRVFRNGHGRCESRWMDEHIVVEGGVEHVHADIADINLNNISWWIDKHNRYASREAIEMLLAEEKTFGARSNGSPISRQARIKRWVKLSVYARLPLGLRSLAYFLYRYFVRLGFLDGWAGLVFHSLQGLWYRFLVDVKVREIRSHMAERHLTLAQVVHMEYGYDITTKPE